MNRKYQIWQGTAESEKLVFSGDFTESVKVLKTLAKSKKMKPCNPERGSGILMQYVRTEGCRNVEQVCMTEEEKKDRKIEEEK